MAFNKFGCCFGQTNCFIYNPLPYILGILALDVFARDTAKILTGGADKNATVFNKDLEQVVAVLKGHSKKVNRVVYHPTEDTVITGSHDTTVRIWNVPTAQTVQVHTRSS